MTKTKLKRQNYRLGKNKELLALHLKFLEDTSNKEISVKLLEIYGPCVMHAVQRMDDAGFDSFDDMASTGYLGLHRALEKFDKDKANSWLGYAFQWIRGRIEQERRDRQTYKRLEDSNNSPDVALSYEKEPYEQIAHDESSARAMNMLSFLPEEYREMAYMHYVENMTSTQIGIACGLSGWVAGHRVREINRLFAEYRDEEDIEKL